MVTFKKLEKRKEKGLVKEIPNKPKFVNNMLTFRFDDRVCTACGHNKIIMKLGKLMKCSKCGTIVPKPETEELVPEDLKPEDVQ
jgi:ribosomal protein S27E